MQRRFLIAILGCLILCGCTFAADLPQQDEVNAWLQKGNAYSKEGLAGLAIRAFSNAIRLAPENHEAFLARGQAYLHLDHLDRALADFDKTIQLKGDMAKAHYWRGTVYSLQDKLSRAISEYSQAIKLEPRLTAAFLARGECFEFKEKFDKALEDFSRVIALAPGRHTGYFLRGHVFSLQKNYTKAIEDYLEALKRDGEDVTTLNNIADTYMLIGQYDTGLHYLASALKIEPSNPVLHMTLGEIFELQKRFPEALEAFKRSRRHALEDTDFTDIVSIAEGKIKQLESALENK